MELRPGYKLTEVGMMPEEWQATKLGLLATLKTTLLADPHHVFEDLGSFKRLLFSA